MLKFKPLTTAEGMKIEIKDDFWKSMDENIKNRLKILVPNTSGGEDQTATTSFFKEVTVGTYSLNPETGAIQIQAPRHIQDEMETYINRINEQYNTQIHFMAKLFVMTLDDNETRGFDLSMFKSIANGYDLVLQNNALGGVTVSTGGTTPVTINTTTPFAGGNGLLGVVKPDSLQIFHSFLTEHANVAVLQEPSLSTSSGIPAKFQKFVTRYYNTISQTTSGGTGDAAVGTTNTLVPVQFGTMLSINPVYDVTKNLVRAQISWEQSLESGSQTVSQFITEASGGSREVPVTIPNVTEATYSGETILKDGDMIIIGGQKEKRSSFDDAGTTGLKDTFLSPLISKKTYESQDVIYYFAIQMHINKKWTKYA